MELKELSVGYNKNILLESVTLSVKEGEFIGLLGQNGSGKSSLFKTILGISRPINGSVYLDGVDIQSISPIQLSKKISIVFTDKPDESVLTVESLIALGRYPHTGLFGKLTAEDKWHIKNAINLFKLTELKNKQVICLSDGERQKAMVARAICQDTPIVLLDEPTAFLDITNKIELLLILKRLCKEKNKSILFSCHDLDMAIKFSDKLWIINEKKIVSGQANQIITPKLLNNAFKSNVMDYDEKTNTIQYLIN